MEEFPEIKPMTVELTAQEVLAMRRILDWWSGEDSGDDPFCHAMSESVLDKLGGALECYCSDHPLTEEWLESRQECRGCQNYFLKSELQVDGEDDDLYCQECFKDL